MRSRPNLVCDATGHEFTKSRPRGVRSSIQSNLGALIVEPYPFVLARRRIECIRPGRAMSPLIERPRTESAPRTSETDQHWGMLLFESLSAGAMAVLLGLAMVMVVVGVYVIVVWPLTFWDLADLGLEKYGSWANTVVWSVFAGGSLAGYWCFSGAAFKAKSAGKRGSSRTRPAGPPRR